MCMAVEQLWLVEKQRQIQQETKQSEEQRVPQTSVKSKQPSMIKFSEWLGTKMIKTGKRVLQYAN